MSSPLRLEAQKDSPSTVLGLSRIIYSSFTGPEIPDDVAEQQLKAQISQSNHDEEIFLTHLLRDYRRFKNAPAFLVVSQFFQSWTFVEDLSNDDVQSNGLIRMTKYCLAYWLGKAKWKGSPLTVKQVSPHSRQRYHNIYFRLVRTDYACCAFSLGFTHYIHIYVGF